MYHWQDSELFRSTDSESDVLYRDRLDGRSTPSHHDPSRPPRRAAGVGLLGQGGAAGRLRLWPACGGAGAARRSASPGGSGARVEAAAGFVPTSPSFSTSRTTPVPMRPATPTSRLPTRSSCPPARTGLPVTPGCCALGFWLGCMLGCFALDRCVPGCFALGCGGVGLVALLLAAACMVALLLVALFPATDLPPSETYLFYVYCVLVIAHGRMSTRRDA